MGEKVPIVSFFGINFNLANDISILLVCAIVFGLVFWLSRRLSVRPNKRQNALEMMIDFTNGIVKSAIPDKDGEKFYLLSFVLFLFVLVSNMIGLALQVHVGDLLVIKSPTADPVVTMSLAMMMLILTSYYGIQKKGFGGYLKGYFQPLWPLFPINLLEEFTNFLTLSLRLYGNIFAGEVLLGIIVQLGMSLGSTGFITFPMGLIMEMVWQGFSMFIGGIQAFVFVTLSMVYMSHKIETE